MDNKLIYTIVNIGAHLGYFTDSCLKLYPNVKKIYCFEPFKANYKFIKTKYRDNGVIEIFNCAVSNFDGEAKFYKKEYNGDRTDIAGNDGSSLVESKINTGSNFDIVKVIKLSSFMSEKNITNLDILKIDAEGSEYDIFDDVFSNDTYKCISMFYYEDHCRKIKGLDKRKANFIKQIKKLNIADRFYLEGNHDEYTALLENKDFIK